MTEKKYVQFITYIFLLKSFYLFKFWKISLLKILKLLLALFYRNFLLPKVSSVQFGLFYIRIFSFFFLLGISLIDTNDSQDSRERRVNHYFSCFPLAPGYEYAFNSSRFLPLFFNRSICNYRTDNWWDLLSLEICILLGCS